MRRTESAGRAFALFATSVGLACAGLFDLYTTHLLSLLWTLALAVAGGAMVDLALVFPQEARLVKDRPYLRWIGYAIGLVLFMLAAINLYNFHHPTAYILNWRSIYILDQSVDALFCRYAHLPADRGQIAGGAPAGRRHPGRDAGCIRAVGGLVLVTASLPQQVPAGLRWLTALFSFNFPPYLLLLAVVFPW